MTVEKTGTGTIDRLGEYESKFRAYREGIILALNTIAKVMANEMGDAGTGREWLENAEHLVTAVNGAKRAVECLSDTELAIRLMREMK